MRLSEIIAGKAHRWKSEVIDLFDITDGVKSIGDFVAVVEKLSLKYKSDDINNQDMNVFKGDMLEIFAEIFFKCFPNDERIGLRGYVPIDLADDFGVDGVGANANGDNCVVQIKYRSDPLDQITYGDLAKTYASGRCRTKFDLEKPDTIFLLTTCNGVRSTVKEVLGNRVRVIHRDVIAGKIDDNMGFWESADAMLEEALS